MDYNYRTVELKLDRIDICDLLLACTGASFEANDGGQKWKRLHEKLKKALDEFDKENMSTIE